MDCQIMEIGQIVDVGQQYPLTIVDVVDTEDGFYSVGAQTLSSGKVVYQVLGSRGHRSTTLPTQEEATARIQKYAEKGLGGGLSGGRPKRQNTSSWWMLARES